MRLSRCAWERSTNWLHRLQCPDNTADATSMDDLKNLFTKSMEHFGSKIDFVLHSIGMSVNVRKGKTLH